MLADLLELVKILDKIFRKEETINPFYKIELSDYPTEYQHYLKLLTHYITLINQKNRTMEKHKFVTSREDIIASLNLLEINTLKHYRTQKQSAEELYEILKNNTHKDQILTAKNIREIIGYKKTQAHQFIQILLKMNKLEQVGGHRNIGFLYKLK